MYKLILHIIVQPAKPQPGRFDLGGTRSTPRGMQMGLEGAGEGSGLHIQTYILHIL